MASFYAETIDVPIHCHGRIQMDRQKLHEAVEKNTTFTFARSGGKGGQNVNKVNTKAHAMMPFAALTEQAGLSPQEVALVKRKLTNCINADGIIVVDADDERFQESNRKIALERMENKIASASYVQPRRRKTKPTAASRERRLKIKKIHSQIKKLRTISY